MQTIFKRETQKLDLDNLIMAGHSLGGATILKFCNLYPEYAKSLIVYDPWILSIEPDIRQLKMMDFGTKIGKPLKMFILNTFWFQHGDCYQFFTKYLSNKQRFENVVMNESHHYV